MRDKVIAQRSLFDQAIDLLVSIFKPNKKLKRMDAIIDAIPDIGQYWGRIKLLNLLHTGGCTIRTGCRENHE